MSIVQLFRSATLAPAPYAYAATAPAGTRLLFLAGACPLDSQGDTACAGDIAGQAAQAMANLRTVLTENSAGISDVVSTRVLVAATQQADLVAAWDVVRADFGDHEPPSTLLGVTVLGYPGQLVEIEAVAAIA